ncbi:DUF1376 domain-containing protein [Psychrobacter immobilis]|uniref:DUF1376 domain-containing protein n=1 Tax=Psychrobacter immobilis TaxID=498 RepID=UPI003FD47109
MRNSKNTSVNSGGMHYVTHNFGEWELETRHMERIGKSIYLDMRANYLKDGKPFTSDVDLLAHRLSCNSDEERKTLEMILKDKFKLDKRTKTYKHTTWETILKNYRARNWQNSTSNTKSSDNVTTDNNDTTSNTPLTAAQRKAKSRSNEKELRRQLSSVGVEHKGVKGMSKLKKLYAQHLGDIKLSNNEVAMSHTGCHEIGTQKEAINSNQETKTKNQGTIERETHTQNIDRENSSISADSYTQLSTNEGDLAMKHIDIESWTAPSIDIMRNRLLQEDLKLDMTEKKYALELENFRAYYSEKAKHGKPLTSDSLRITRWHQWLKRELKNHNTTNSNKKHVEDRFNIDNEDWEKADDCKLTNQNANGAVGNVYHPSHSCSKNNSSKFNSKTEVLLNGCRRAALPEMTSDETYAYIAEHQAPGESQDETYDRLVSRKVVKAGLI